MKKTGRIRLLLHKTVYHTAKAFISPVLRVKYGEHLLRNRVYGKLLRHLADPIPIPKGGASLKA